MIKLTPRQSEILAFIKRCLEENGYPPTRAEIAQELGFKSPNAAEEHLKALNKKGAIEMTPGASRGIRIPGFEPATEESGLPIIGRVAAGAPVWYLVPDGVVQYINKYALYTGGDGR